MTRVQRKVIAINMLIYQRFLKGSGGKKQSFFEPFRQPFSRPL
jgi:hypothetical protein